MGPRTLLVAGLALTATIAFPGTLAGTTGIKIAAPAAAECLTIDGEECLPSPTCILAGILGEIAGDDHSCTR